MNAELKVLSRKPDQSFAAGYWRELMEVKSSLEAVYLMGAAGKALRNVGQQTLLRDTGVTRLTPQDLDDPVVATRLCSLTCVGATGGVLYCSQDRSHLKLLSNYYDPDTSGTDPEDFGIWFRENLMQVSRNDLLVWCFTYDADAAILKSPRE